MLIKKIELNKEIENFIGSEQESYEAKNGLVCHYNSFCFVANLDNEIVGAITGATLFSEIYIDEIVVKSAYRRQGIGTSLVATIESYYVGQVFDNINCCTHGFQAPKFYEKCGFKLEFVRKNQHNPQLNKYFYIKYLNKI